MAARRKAPRDGAPWSDRDVADLCIVDRLVGLATKEGIKSPGLTEWYRARGAFCDAAVAGRPAPRQRAQLRAVTEKIRQAFALLDTESA